MRRALRIILRILTGAATLLSVLLVIAWLTGRIWSDRYALSQWLAWIPTPCLAIAVVVGLACASWPRGKPWLRRIGVRAWLVTGAVLLVHFSCFEHHLLRRPADPGAALEIVNWNVTHFADGDDTDRFVEPVLSHLGDITILVNASGINSSDRVMGQVPEGMVVATVGRATVLSKYRLIEARQAVISDSGNIVLLRFWNVPGFEGRLTVYVVDLPSDPRRSRALITSGLRQHIDAADLPPPDIVLGDFNIPRGSASLAALFPGLRNAYDEAGHGYGATFHRGFPLYHIDHVLLGGTVSCRRYDLIDPGVGRHLIQRAWVVARK